MTASIIQENRPVTDIRKGNIRNILMLLRQKNLLSRQDLCRHVGLTGAGLSRNIQELLNAGLVIEEIESPVKGRLGRRRSLLRLNPDGAYAVGITIAANRKSVSLMNAVGYIMAEQELPDLDLTDPVVALDAIADAGHAMVAKLGIDSHRVLGAGVVFGVPDSVVMRVSENITSPTLGWKDTPVVERLRSALNLPVKVVPRARALLQVEIENFQNIKSGQAFLLINCGVGLGSAFQVFDQTHWQAIPPTVQISHIALTGDSTPCKCGRTGCLEQTAGGAGVVRHFIGDEWKNNHDFNEASRYLEQVFSAAAAGDNAAKDAFFKTGKRFARGIDIAHALLQPDHIFVAGEVGRQADFVRGIWAGLAETNTKVTPTELSICDTRSAYASGLFALDEFLFTDSLELSFLQSLSREAS